MAERFFLGVDAGGTKTDACVCDDSGRVLGFGAAGAGNWESVGLDGVGAALGQAVTDALGRAGLPAEAIEASVFALAGMDWASDRAPLHGVASGLGLGGSIAVINDAFAALRAGSETGTGIVSIAGTGGLTAGRSADGRVFRTMGLHLGEAGGSYALVLEALSSIARARNGHPLADTVLAERFIEHAGVTDVDALFEGIARENTTVDNEFARIVLAVASAGDPEAIRIVTTEGTRHGDDVIGVASALGLAGNDVLIVRAGGVHVSGNAHFDSAFAATVSAAVPGAVITRLDAPPVTGAVLLAMETDGQLRPEVTSSLGREISRHRDDRRSVVVS